MATKSHRKHHKKNPHHTESSPSHDTRKEHDQKTRQHEQDVYAGGGVSRNVQIALVVVAGLVVVTLTVMFIGGFIAW
jgi:ABC-type nickel/cobalt efflux system permease component RcnA